MFSLLLAYRWHMDQDSQLDFSDLSDELEGVRFSIIDQSGLRHLTPEERAVYMKEQARVQRVADLLLEATISLVDALKEVRSTRDIYDLLQTYYRQAGLILDEGKVPSTSNAVKLLSGLWEEFSTIISDRNSPDEKQRLGSRKMKNLVRVLTNFSGALLTAKNECNWDAVEDSVFDLLGIVPVRAEDLSEQAVALAGAKTHIDLLNVLNCLEANAEEAERVKRQKLALFAAGEISLRQLELEREPWQQIQGALKITRKLLVDKSTF